MKKIELVDDHRCFVCGMKNEEGLRIHWKVEGQTMTGTFVPEAKYQGWEGIVHGGILATVLDEAMTRLAGILYGGAVTAEMTIRFVAPASIGEKLWIQGEVVKEGRIVEMKSVILGAKETVIARATGKILKV